MDTVALGRLMAVRIICGDALTEMAKLPAESVHMAVTSPPYYGLRSYGTPPQVFGGDPACEHDWQDASWRADRWGVHDDDKPGPKQRTNGGSLGHRGGVHKQDTCRCGAWRGDLGLEPTMSLYLDHMVEIFREVWRVLRNDGTFWLNIGDSFSNDTKWGGSSGGKHVAALHGETGVGRTRQRTGLKPKDLMMIPARLAIRLQDDGWWLRSEIVWAKKSPMPESVTDRPTSAHEKVFLFAKSQRYFYDNTALAQAINDADAIVEPYNPVYEDLHKMPSRKAGRSVCQGEEGQERPIVAVPSMPCGVHEGGAGNTDRARGVAAGVASIQCNASTEDQTARIREIGETSGDSESVEPKRGWPGERGAASEDGQKEGGAQALLRQREGEGCDRPLSGNPEGEGVLGSRCAQTARSDAHTKHPNRPGVGKDKRARQIQMSLLSSSDETSDDGSCDPIERGRSSRRSEHRPGVSVVQFQQEQQNSPSNLTNARNFWLLGPEPFPEAHFATFVTEIPRRAILAGTSARGVCPLCGAPWVRVSERIDQGYDGSRYGKSALAATGGAKTGGTARSTLGSSNGKLTGKSETTGWSPSCRCPAAEPVPATVLDCFGGAGTTGVVADRMGRNAILIELSESYAGMARRRLEKDAGLFAEIAAE